MKNKYTDSKKVEDGWEYVLDAKGNVMKDSLGNDIKTKKYKTISCDVIETVQKKESTIGAVVQFFTANNELIQSVPVSSVANFQYISATAIGDLNALSDASRAKLQHTLPAAFALCAVLSSFPHPVRILSSAELGLMVQREQGTQVW